MSAGKLCCLCVTTLVLACGATDPDAPAGSGGAGAGATGGSGGAGEGGGGSGAGGTVDGCVDIYVDASLLAEPERWRQVAYPLRGGAWLTDHGVHVAWMAHEWMGEDVFGDVYHPWLVLSTFDAQTGELVDHRLTDAIPPYVDDYDGFYSVVGAGPDGRYLVRFNWLDSESAWHDDVLVARVAEDETVIGELTGETVAHCHIAWDGEAFAIHGSGGNDPLGGKRLFVGRVGTDGDIVLPFTQFGRINNVCYPNVGFQTSTVAETGITYVLNADGVNELAGHLRDGSPLPGTENGPKLIEAIGTVTPPATAVGAISATVDGGWVLWNQSDPVQGVEVLAQRIDPQGDPIDPAFELRAPREGIDGVPWRYEVLARPGGAAQFVAFMGPDMFAIDHDGDAPGEPRLVWDNSGDRSPYPHVQDLLLFDDAGGVPWLAWNEQVDDELAQWRVMRLKPGCVYPSLRKKAGLND